MNNFRVMNFATYPKWKNRMKDANEQNQYGRNRK